MRTFIFYYIWPGDITNLNNRQVTQNIILSVFSTSTVTKQEIFVCNCNESPINQVQANDEDVHITLPSTNL